MAINEKCQDDCGYVCFFEGKRIELYAKSLYEAKVLATNHWKVRKSNQHLVSAHLAENSDAMPHIGVADF